MTAMRRLPMIRIKRISYHSFQIKRKYPLRIFSNYKVLKDIICIPLLLVIREKILLIM